MPETSIFHNVYLFKDLNSEELSLVGKIIKVKTLNAGDTLFEQDDLASAMYIVKFGSVSIHQKTESGERIEVTVLGTGSHFGEMAFIDDERRSATATAIEKTDILEISYDDLSTLLKRHLTIAIRFYKALSHFLCGRLRLTTLDLSFAREKNLTHF